MEELISGPLDAGPGSSPEPPYRPAGAVATLDLTGDRAPAPGPFSPPVPGARATGDDLDADGPGPSGSGRPLRLPRIPFPEFVAEESDRLLGTAYLLTGDRRVAERLLRQALAEAAVGWSQRASEPMTDVLQFLTRPVTGRLWWGPVPRPMVDAGLSGDLGSRLSALPARQRAGLVLRYHQRRTEEEVAVALRAPAGNVRTWISRALDRLGIEPGLDLRPRPDGGLSRAGLTAALQALSAPVDEGTVDERTVDEGTVDERTVDDASVAAGPQLQDRLDDVGRRLPGLRRQAGRRRLGRRLALGAAGLGLVAGAVALAGPAPDPIVDDRAGSAGTTGLTEPTAPAPPGSLGSVPTSTADALDESGDWARFASDLGGDPLLVAVVGAQGQAEVEVRFTPSTTNLAFTAFCRTADGTDLWSSATLNGHQLLSGGCSAEDRANGSTYSRDDYPKIDRAGWWGEGVRPGRESVLRFRLVNAKGRPQSSDRVRLGFAVYQLTGPRVVSRGVIIKRTLDDDAGRGYRLGGYRTAKVTKARTALTLDVPAGTGTRSGSALILVGMPDSTSESYESMLVRVDGAVPDRGQSGGTYTFSLSDAGAHRVSIRPRPDDTGVMVVAWYRQ